MLLQTNNKLTLTSESNEFLNVSRFKFIIPSCPPSHSSWREGKNKPVFLANQHIPFTKVKFKVMLECENLWGVM